MTTNIAVQEITPSGLSEPKTITLSERPTFDRIQQKLREVLKSEELFLINQDLVDNIDIASASSRTFKYYRTNVHSPQADPIVCRNGAILSVKHEATGQTISSTEQHEELSAEECAKLLERVPPIGNDKSLASSSNSAPVPAVENIFRSESASRQAPPKSTRKSEKTLRIRPSFLDLGAGSQFLALEFNHPVQQTEVHFKSKPELPEGKWQWVSSTRVVYSANRFPGSTDFKLSYGSFVLDDGTKDSTKGEYSFSTNVVDIASAFVEYSKNPVIMVIFNQRVKSTIAQSMHCVDVGTKPYTPTEDVNTLFKTSSAIAAYERAKHNDVSVVFFKPDRWPLNTSELTCIVNSGSHSEEGPLPSKGIKHAIHIDSLFTIRPIYWVNIPISVNPTFQLSKPLHPECLADIRNYIHVTTEVQDIIVQGNQICIKVPQKGMDFDVTFKGSLMSVDGTILGSEFKRSYKKYRGMFCMPVGNDKITNVDTPTLQMIASSLKYEYEIFNASFDGKLAPQVGARVGGGDITLPELQHEMQIFKIDLAHYFGPEQKLLAVTVKDQGTYFVQKTNWLVDTFAHENGIEISVYTKDLKPVNNPTIVYYTSDQGLVDVKDKAIIPSNATSFKVVADGDWAVFTVPETGFERIKPKLDLYTTTDRGLYQPGEKVHVIGFARDANGGYPSGNLKYVVKDGHGTEISKGVVDVKSSPSFDFEIQLPSSASPGTGEIKFSMNDVLCHQMKFQIREFRIPDNEVLVSSSPNVASNTLDIDTEVKSFIGDDVTGATTTGSFVVKNDTLSLPQYPGFSFYSPALFPDPLAKFTGELGGSSSIKSKFQVNNSISLLSVEYNAETRLGNGDRLTGSHVASLRPRGLAVGLNIQRDQFSSAAFPFSFNAIVIDENDDIVNGAHVYFEVWSKIHDQISLVKDFVKQVHQGEPITVALQPGEYFIQAYVCNNHGHVTSTRSEVFAIANDLAPKSVVQVTLDKSEYAPNEIAKVKVTGLPPYFKRGLCNVYVKGNELVKLSRTLDGSEDFTIDLPLHNNLAPKASVYCSVIGLGASVDGPEIHLNLVGSTTLIVRSERDVKFSLNVSKHVGPAEKTQVTCEFEQPLNEDVKLTVWAVDDAVLKLAQYVLEHPLEYLSKKKSQYKGHTSLTVPPTSKQQGWTSLKVVYVKTLTGKQIAFVWRKGMTLLDLKTELESREGIPVDQGRLIYFGKHLADNDRTLEDLGVVPGSTIYLVLRLRGDGGGSSTPTQNAPPITVRKSTGPLAWFKTVNVSKGTKSLDFEVDAPTDLKRFKVFALAIGATLASKQESVFNVTKPFSISALVLRQLCVGDKTLFPVTLYNRQEHDVQFKVAARTKSLSVIGSRGFSGVIKANSSTSVEFNLTAGETFDGALQIVAVGRANGQIEHSDAIEYPVRVKNLTVRRNVFGRFENKNETLAHVIDINEHIIGTGEININLSPSILSQGIEALTYLGDYRYMCSEQMSSQLLVALPYLTLGSHVHVPNQKSTQEIKDNIKSYIKALSLRHLGHGEFSYWNNGTNYTYVDPQVAHALIAAKSAGFEVPEHVLYSCREHAKSIIENAKKASVKVAYSAYFLYLAKENLSSLIEKLKTLGKSAKSVIALAYLAAIPETKLIDTLAKKMSKSAAAALEDSEDGAGRWTMLNSIPKLCSLTILALLENKSYKDPELLNQTMSTLLSSRKSGHWMNTNANMWSLTALAEFHNKVEKDVNDNYNVKVWLGKKYLGELTPASQPLQLHFDTSTDLKSLPQLTLQLTGSPVWYSAQIKLDSTRGEKSATDKFTIARRVFGIERAEDVKEEEKDGRKIYRVRHGAHVGIEVKVNDTHYDSLRFFAVQDPVAAGLEPLEKISNASSYYRWGRVQWSHIDVRLDGVDAFADYFYGSSSYTYKALALRKGTYTMPSCHVEDMYKTETFGDSETAIVIVE